MSRSISMPSPSELSKLKKDQLKEACKERNLPISGNKPDLISRLELSYHEEEGDAGGDTSRIQQNGHGKMDKPEKPMITKRRRTTSQNARQHLKEERESIVLWRKPFTTVSYSTRELAHTLADWAQWLFSHKITLLLLISLLIASATAYQTDFAKSPHVREWEKYAIWCLWWVGLGVLSSVGLGTGLHTFLLYLGPHIASVTLAAYECGTTDFPSPPYPDSIVCPENGTGAEKALMTIWQILSKVRVEAFCWGVGTALGELPPYFMARAHRLSGYDPDEEEDEYLQLQEKLAHPEQLNIFDRAKLGIEKIVEKMGFLGILACASIPNPLFDLAGITCGHFLVPFWTFFGATLIGKAVVKMHIQKIFVIMAFNENLLNTAVGYIAAVPVLGTKVAVPFKALLRSQKEKLHVKAAEKAAAGSNTNVLSWIFENFVLLMVCYFVLSIINSLAQSYHKRINKKLAKTESGKID